MSTSTASTTTTGTPGSTAMLGPSKQQILKATAVALIVAAVILVTVVLPAEYAIDPTGLGRRMGLVALTQPAAAPPVPPNEALPLAPAENTNFYATAPHSNVIEIPLKLDGELEYKVRMKKGDTITYSWNVDKGAAYYDFHGESEPDKRVVRYKEEQAGAPSGYGSLTAPFDGIHGWYWLNIEDHPIVITLRVNGFYQLRPQTEQPVGTVKQ